MYDVVIVGAGPAGLFSAYELIKNNKNLKIMLIDKGKEAKNRFCPMNKNKDGKCLNCNPCAISGVCHLKLNKTARFLLFLTAFSYFIRYKIIYLQMYLLTNFYIHFNVF